MVNHTRPCIKMRSITRNAPSCYGGFCEFPQKPTSNKSMISKDEGVPPPIRKQQKDVYQLSYPGKPKIEPVNITPLYILWMGRRWYASP